MSAPTRRAERRRGGALGLLVAEARRLRSRRLFRWLVGLFLLGYAVAVPALGLTQYERTTPAVLAEARTKMNADLVQQQKYYAECLKQMEASPPPDGASAEQMCGPEPGSYLKVEDYLPRRPFSLATDYPIAATAVGVGVAVLAFVVGASWSGAEWSARTMMALLFWEPRRLRVLVAKIVTLALGVGLLAAIMQAVWAGSGWALASARGSTAHPADFWPTTAGLGLRATVLAMIVGLLGFGIAHLVRHTGAALGAAFVYFVIIENLVNGFLPRLRPWLLTTNAAALLADGGLRLEVPTHAVDTKTGEIIGFKQVLLTNLHGGLVLGGVAAAILVVGAWLFRRRDLT